MNRDDITRPEALRDWMQHALARLLEIEPAAVPLGTRFRELGLGSKQLLQLLAQLSEHTGVSLPVTLAWEQPTPDALLRHVAAGLATREHGGQATPGARAPSGASEPIAILGIGCRLPGGVASPDDYWQLLCDQRTGVREVPAERFDIDAWFDADVRAKGKLSTRWAGLLDGIDRFDAAFFGISPREARQMDPQQRLALELVWDALEDAGVRPLALRDQPVGVFMGAMWSDYARIIHDDVSAIDSHSATGQDTSIISARVSYLLGLSGTSLTVNTACSSSAVAIHLAVQSLRSGETSMALAGGVSVLSSPESTVAMSKFGAMNPAGQCRAFDASANGYVRGEGGGVLLLKPLTRALADGDAFYCVIRGTAANNDGFSNGLTAPSPKAQQAVLRSALRAAGLAPSAVQYVETHGPGTILGDPIEAGAIAAVYCAERTNAEPLRIGSAKTNLGHLEAAAGVAGLIKAALALQHRMLPANLHFEQPNPHIAFDALRLRVQTQLESWPVTSERPRASVSSFGFGGTNCHIVLEAAPGGSALLLPIAADHPKELRRRVAFALGVLAQARSWKETAALGRAIAVRCARGRHRTAVLSEYPEELRDRLNGLLSETVRSKAVVGRPRLVFVCSGQGSQWLGMARALLTTEPVFREVIERCDRFVRAQYGWSVIDELVADAESSRLASTDVTQLALASVQIALGTLWRSWGIDPDALVGHSVGEVSACHLAGVLSLEDALRIVGERALLLRDLPDAGGMLVVTLREGRGLAEVLEACEGLDVGAYNSPDTIVLSGAFALLERAERTLAERGLRAERVNIAYASHSARMDPLLAPLRERLRGIAPRDGRVPVRSTLRDAWVSSAMCGPDYWVEHLRRPVRFQQAIETLAQKGPTLFVELSPHPVLLKPIAQTLAALGVASGTLATCRRGEDERCTLLAALAELYRAGFDPDWTRVFRAAAEVSLSTDAVQELEVGFGARVRPHAFGRPLPFVVSARGEASLRGQAERLQAHVEARPELEALDVAYSLAATRSTFDSRAVVVASDRAQLLEGLKAIAAGQPAPIVATGEAKSHGKLVFVFPGQGSQWLGMAKELSQSSPVFARELRACADALAPHVDWSLLEVLASAEEEAFARVDVVQPVLFSVMVSLSALWRSHGVIPDAVVGHSQGEIAAAYVAGGLSLHDAARVVALRARALKRLSGRGGMAAVELPAAELRERLKRFEGRVSVAADNSPQACVVSGDDDALDALLAELSASEILGRRVRVDYASHCAHLEQIEGELLRDLAPIEPRQTELPMYSSVNVEVVAGEALGARYWYRNGRECVRFRETLELLLAQGHTHFVEVSPHPVLTQAVQSTATRVRVQASAVGTLRRDQGSLSRFMQSLGELHVRGYAVNWARVLDGGRKVPLPTYAFSRESHWIDAGRAVADIAAAGLSAGEHPLLGASVVLAEEAGAVFTARLSLANHPWLSGHEVFGATWMPGTGLVELALTAAHRVGLDSIEELTLETPLVLPERGSVQLQLSVGALDARGTRAVHVHSRRDEGGVPGPWTRHASGQLGTLSAETARQRVADAEEAFGEWPPPGAEQVALDGFYESLASSGLKYGEAFRGLHAVYRKGDTLFASLELPKVQRTDAAKYALHPALLDAALHVALLQGGELALPFAWRGVSLKLTGAETLRVRVDAPHSQSATLLLADESGQWLGAVDALRMRVASERQAKRATESERQLFCVTWPVQPSPAPRELDWVCVGSSAGLPESSASYPNWAALSAAIAAGRAAPEVVVFSCLDATTDAHAPAHRSLEAIQTWIADERLTGGEGSELVFVTRGAVAALERDRGDGLACAPVWGLVRSAQSEYPQAGIRIVDLEERESGPERKSVPELERELPLSAAFLAALASDEAQLAVRDGELRAPRIAAQAGGLPLAAAHVLDFSSGTVLITGGTGMLGGIFARHLVRRYGVRHLVLASRSGRADALTEELEAEGASVVVAACDVSQRSELEALLASLEHPLVGVIHAAGALDDGIVGAQTAERIDRVFGPKLDGALHLHDLTREQPLQAFVLFSSLSGLVGTRGQSNYAAANTFLDALAHHRRAQGLPATSLCWGYWAERSGLTAHLGELDLERMRKSGMTPLASEEALALFDAALACRDPQLVLARFDAAALAAAQVLPAVLRDFGRRRLRLSAASTARAASFEHRFAQLSGAARERALLDAVLGAVSAVLGAAASQIPADRPLSESGLDSLMAVELRNQLSALSGLRLPSTLLFDHPTPAAVARYLEVQWAGDKAPVEVKRRRAPAAEPVAIVAMSCRYPGGADSPEALWRLLEAGVDAIGDFPPGRGWDAEALFDPDPEARGKTTLCKGGFLHDAADFDAAFFGISPREALAMDPQQRLLLEASWEALERAGIDPRSLYGSSTGVFVGMWQNTYAAHLPGELEGYAATGGATSVASGRIAYSLGLEGPAVTIDTACSSSLVALHWACQSLRQGECDLALAGGVAVMSTPDTLVAFSRQRGLAPDGRCKPFSDAADGTSFSEGVGLVVLERRSDAERNGRRPLALVRGSAINQDGKSQGLTAPNGPAQERVIRSALASAQLTAADVDAVEAHGTGTMLGDPIEGGAILATYGAERAPGRPLWLGSLKSNIGHTQAAAGIAGVLKMVLSMQHDLLPRSLHSETPTHHVDWSSGAVQLLQSAVEWKRNGKPRRAAISSFGISGTNAHVVIEEAQVASAAVAREPSAPPAPLPFALSARSEASLRGQAQRLHAHLEAHPQLEPLDVAYSLGTTRSAFESRAVLVASERAQLLEGLRALGEGRPVEGGVTGEAKSHGKLVFVFPGQGSQWLGMAQELLASSPVFARELKACSEALAPFVEWSLLDVLARTDDEVLTRVDVVQPVLFAVMVSLCAVWRSYGVHPDAVVGHSQGEIAAAYVAGALSLSDAARVVALRARALTHLSGRGGMAAIELPAAELRERLTRFEGRVSVAADNSPQACVVSGDNDALDALLAELSAAEILGRRVRVDYASHCAHLESIEEELLRELAAIQPRRTQTPMYSTVRVEVASGEQLDAAYWYRNGRESVRFRETLELLLAQGHTHFVEVSPHPVLTQAVQSTANRAGVQVSAVGTLRRDQGSSSRFVQSLGELHVRGFALDWARALPGGRKVELPTYAFTRERYWLASGQSVADIASAGLSAGEHPLLGAAIVLAEEAGAVFTSRLSLSSHAWLAGHVVFGATLMPGTGFLELALTAAHRVGLDAIEELTLEAPLVLPERGSVQLQLSVGALDARGTRSLHVHSRRDDSGVAAAWTRHASGVLGTLERQRANEHAERAGETFSIWPPPGATPVELEDFYASLAAVGLTYGEAFRGLEAVYRRGDSLFASVELPAGPKADAAQYALHPALLDAALHVLLLQRDDVVLPFAWRGVSLRLTGAEALRVQVDLRQSDGATLLLADESGQWLGAIDALRVRAASEQQLRRAADDTSVPYRVDWVPAAAALDVAPQWAWLGIPDSLQLSESLPSALSSPHYADLPVLEATLEAGESVPELIVMPCVAAPGELPSVAREVTARVLVVLQAWLANPRFAAHRLVVVTRGAVSASSRDTVERLELSPIWGLVRAAQSEHPEAGLRLIDLDLSTAGGALEAALALREPQIAVRDATCFVPRLAPSRGDGWSIPSDARAWSVQVGSAGTLEGLAITAHEILALRPGEVRVEVRAAGVNFRDVLSTLGMYPGEPGPIGLEGAGIVVEVSSDVTALQPGDRVMGMLPRAFGPTTAVDQRSVAPIPAGLSFASAASIPAVFLTAFYGLRDLAGLVTGERVLVHAAAGGVGMAAVQLARHLGAEVFATASPSKWPVLRGLGLDDAHIASSRTLDFETRFRSATGGAGVDVVLNSLAHEFVDASLRLLRPNGRFIEMGKTDVRDPAEVAASHSVRYRAFDLVEAGLDRYASMLRALHELFERGVLRPLSTNVWDVRHAQDAFRFMAQARHVGKIVLTMPRRLSGHGTVLITGGTGTLGALVAEHLVTRHGVRHLVLCSRSAEAAALRQRLTVLGATVTIAQCDVSRRSDLEALLRSIPAAQPLRAVFHTAGALADGIIEAQDAARIEQVFAPKLDGAWHLHELTRELDLEAFVLFSSLAGVLGTRGQSNYAAANAFLDALAHHRRSVGLPAASLDWGYWAERSGLTAHLDQADVDRLARSGIAALSTRDALAMLDRALEGPGAQWVAARFSSHLFDAPTAELPAVLQGLAGRRLQRVAAPAASFQARIARLTVEQRERALRGSVRDAIAKVMSVQSSGIDPERPLSELGLDSLMAVELRNHLAAHLGLRLPSTLLFDHPTPNALARYVASQLAGEAVEVVQPRAAAPVSEPIAIVAMSCRYPGGAHSPEALWRLLDDATDAIGDFPTARGWDSEALFDPDPDAKGKVTVCKGGFLPDIAAFDAAFFGISPREALAMDPQQRLLLEVSWEAFERAGIDPRSLAGSSTGVFVGAWQNGYAADLPGELEGYTSAGGHGSVVSGRIAYTLGLQGPAVTVDTACSSSLVALHWACQSLRQRECDLALAGGATIMTTPSLFVEFSRQRGLAADGRCKPFSETADGTSFSEGVGLLVLERASDAQRHGRTPLALVRGSAINQDGKSQGLTAPNGPAQERVIRQALASAQLSAEDVDAVEAHGTGTTLGDPIEGQAIVATYGAAHAPERPLWLGSLKSNLGHMQAAAGVAGVMKMVLALQHAQLPRSLHAQTPTHHVDWSSGTVRLLHEAIEWPRNGRPRRAGVSSFGISGTNAHVILEESGEFTPDETAAAPAQLLPFPISARTEAALHAQADQLRAHVDARPSLALQDLAHSLAWTRAAFEERAVVLAEDREGLLAGLTAIAASQRPASVIAGTQQPVSRLAYLFAGQGSQLPQMGAGLYERFPVFRAALDAIFDDFASLPRAFEPSVRDVMFAEPGSSHAALLDTTEYTQPALFGLEVALYRLLESWGVRPEYLLGHSVGEIAAAHVAGVLSRADACTLVAARGRLMQALPAGGAMLSLEASKSELHPLLQSRASRVSLAAVNGARSLVVSGDELAVLELAEWFEAESRKVRRLSVSHAFHSAHMDPMLAEFERVVQSLDLRPAQLNIVSSVTGALAAPETYAQPNYWVSQAREAVLFHPGLQALHAAGVNGYLELGPQGGLSALARQALEDEGESNPCVWPVLRKQVDDRQSLLRALAAIHASGHAVDWKRYLAPYGGRNVPLPTYAFQRAHYWLPAPKTGDLRAAGLTPAAHPLLGASLQLPEAAGAVFTGRLSRTAQPWLAEHVVFGSAIVPGTAVLELALVAAERVGLAAVHELILEAPLALPDTGQVQIHVAVGPLGADGVRSFGLYARPAKLEDEVWTCHARGVLGDSGEQTPDVLRQWPPAGARAVELDGLYEGLEAAGLEFGATFRGLRAVYERGDQLFAEVQLPGPSGDGSGYTLHPALLDAALRALWTRGDQAEVRLPFAWQGVRLTATGASALRVQLTVQGGTSASLVLADHTGEPLGHVDTLSLRPASSDQVRASKAELESLYRVDWLPVALPSAASASWASLAEIARHVPAASQHFADIAALGAALERGEPVPAVLVLECEAADVAGEGLASSASARTAHALAVLQAWLADERLRASRLLIVTRSAVAAGEGDDVRDLVCAPLWGLVRSAQSEYPDRSLTLLDLDLAPISPEVWGSVLSAAEPQLALRDGGLRAPRLVRVRERDALPIPSASSPWSLQIRERGTLDGLAFVAHPSEALAPDQVRVEVRAAGVNFRDVLSTLGMYPGDPGPLGYEGAGVVLEVGGNVVDLPVGSRVMGPLSRAFGPTVVAERKLLTAIPSGLSFAEAASIPVAFLTAHYGLLELARLQPGERVLVHAAAGGVGMAAVQIARHLGAEVFATASPNKWPQVRALGLSGAHVASSRSLEFESVFRAATGGGGVDVVLNSLAGEFVDASLRLLRPGGRFIEMGKTDVREPAAVFASHGGALYRAFDLYEAGPERLQQMLLQLSKLFEAGALRPLPVRVRDVRHAPGAFRAMAQARHVGKLVLSVPRSVAESSGPLARGTVLITGGSGTLAAILARHLVTEHGVRRLLLCSRTGRADALQSELEALGAHVSLAACDVADRMALEFVLKSIPAEHPLSGVFHTAAVIDDAVLSAQTAQRIERVFAPKVAGAWNLHALTRDCDLAAFVMFSSAAGVLGTAGQSNYAAANAFLDALAAARRAAGLAGSSIAWGLWAEQSGLTAQLTEADRARMARAGVGALGSEQALRALDHALASPDPQLVPVRFNLAALGARTDSPPAILRGLIAKRTTRAATAQPQAASLQARVATLAAPERSRVLLEAVTSLVVSVTGAAPASIPPERALSELGLDSLMAVELRNQLSVLSGLRLSPTLLFNYPTPIALARMLEAALEPAEAADAHAAEPLLAELDRLEARFTERELAGEASAVLAERLEALMRKLRGGEPARLVADDAALFAGADDEQLFQLIDQSIGNAGS